MDRTWRSADRRWLVDEVVDEPGVTDRVWDAEGAPAATAANPAEPRWLLDALGMDPDELQQVLASDRLCE